MLGVSSSTFMSPSVSHVEHLIESEGGPPVTIGVLALASDIVMKNVSDRGRYNG